jgi:hypothetical protein
MFYHYKLGNSPGAIRQQLSRLIHSGEITLGGYSKEKIYGTLHCSAGKRMNIINRVFFKDEAEALQEGYRPCGRCMPDKYRQWKIRLAAG